MIIKQVLQQNRLVKLVQKLPYYRLLVQHFNSQKLNQEWFDKIRNLPFQRSHFGINEVGQQQRVYDDTVRKSEFIKTELPELDEIANYYLQCWSKQSLPNILCGQSFNCLRYPDGHFAWHMDKYRVKQGYEHIGTIIFIPPAQLAQYEGGTLVVIDLTNQELLIDPQEKDWTFVLMPLGYMHTVEQVKGMRYSFTREIYFNEGHKLKKMEESDKLKIMKEFNEKQKATKLCKAKKEEK